MVKRIRRFGRKSLLKSIEALEPSFKTAFLGSIADIKSAAQMSVIVRALEENRLDDVIRALHLSPEFFAPLDDAIRAAYLQGGRDSLAALPALTEPGGGRLEIRFGGNSPRAQRWVSNHSSNLITAVSQDAKASARTVIEEAIRIGRNPRSTALDLVGRINKVTGRREGGIIGLTNPQTGHVIKARSELFRGGPRGMSKFLGRKRRNKSFDKLILKHIADGTDLSLKDVDRIVQSYENSLLLLRGETVARTESLAAFNAGQQEGVAQLVESGAVEQEQVRRVWRTSKDSRVRDLHQTMDGESVGLNETFSNGLLFPAEPGGAPEQVINCRCVAETRIDFLVNL